MPRAVVLLVLVAACTGEAARPSPCAPADVVVHGACIGRAEADRYCGVASLWEDGACALRACGGDQVRDEISGACLGARDLRAIAEREHVFIDENHVARCDDKSMLRVAGGHVRCAPHATIRALARDRCPRGAVLDARAEHCVTVANGRSVDVATWARAVFGADGGAGAPSFCARVGIDPEAYGMRHGGTSFVDVEIELVLPDNDVTLVTARAHATEQPGLGIRRDVAALGDALVQRAVSADVELLRAFGGASTAASVSTHVRCAIHGGSAPFADVASRSP